MGACVCGGACCQVAIFAMEAVKVARTVPVDPDDPSRGHVRIR